MVTVIVANYNQLSTLPLVLRSFACQTQLPERVIVADDGSCDGSSEWVDALPDDAYPFELRYTTGRHNLYGLTVSENRAARQVPNGRLLFTNADVVHAPDSVHAHSTMVQNEITGGRVNEIRFPESQRVTEGAIDDFLGFMDEFGSKLSDLSNHEYVIRDVTRNIYGIWGGNFSIDVSRFLAIGGFNEEYQGLYGAEEADLIKRFQKAGGGVNWVYNSTAYHLGHQPKPYRAKAMGNVKFRAEMNEDSYPTS